MQVIQSQNSFDPLNSKPRPINRLLVCLIPIFAVWVQYVLLGRMYREHNSENINTKCLSLSAWCLAFNWASSGWPPSNPSIYNICNTLVRWADGENDSSTKHLMFQALFFFITSCKILCKKPFQLFFLFFKKITEIKSFECSKSIRSYEKKNTWSLRRLVEELFVLSSQRTSVLYCRLSDFSFIFRFLLHLPFNTN